MGVYASSSIMSKVISSAKVGNCSDDRQYHLLYLVTFVDAAGEGKIIFPFVVSISENALPYRTLHLVNLSI
jgi:hypothetical protein